MNDKTKDKSSNNKAISPFAMDKTYGEKRYDFIFHNLIDFWVNLTTSAAFSFWVFHSKSPIKLPGMKNAAKPAEIFESLRGKMAELPFVKLFKTDDTKKQVSGSMAGTLVLTSMGHVVMIPSAWIGAKIKSSFVRNEDRKHYGDEAMQSDDLKARHATIDAEERPTFIGAVVGRVGTVVATQTAAYTLGSKINIFRWIGEKTNIGFLGKFRGIDDTVEKIGAEAGGIVRKYARRPVEFAERQLSEGVEYSAAQVKEHPDLIKADGTKATYGSVKTIGGLPEHYLRYGFADVMYTFVTTMTMVPAINFLKKFVPGLTYKPNVSLETDNLAASVPTHLATSQATQADDQRAKIAESVGPRTRINSISKDETVRPRMDQQLTPTTG